jgi:SAM-dependent methyltransferase
MSAFTAFDATSRYYDLLYREKDYAGEATYIDRLLKRHGAGGADLLDFGSGTGRHGRLLGEMGYRVTGIERSASMVAMAEQTENFSCQLGDICSVRLGRSFDAVLSLFHVVSYQTGNREVQAVFANAAEHLNPGGLFVFDVWYSPAVHAQRPEVRVKRLSGDGAEITRIAEPVNRVNENAVDVHYTIFARALPSGEFESFSEIHPMRHFSIPEIDLLASAAGFQRICAEEFLTGEHPSASTWGVCFALRKIRG